MYDAQHKPTLGDGEVIKYFSRVDNHRNVEAVKTSSPAKVDAVAPTTTDDVPSAPQASAFSVTLTATDTGGSGVAKTYYTTDGSTPTTSSAAYDPAGQADDQRWRHDRVLLGRRRRQRRGGEADARRRPSDADADGHADADGSRDADRHADADRHDDADADGYPDAVPDGDADPSADRHATPTVTPTPTATPTPFPTGDAVPDADRHAGGDPDADPDADARAAARR